MILLAITLLRVDVLVSPEDDDGAVTGSLGWLLAGICADGLTSERLVLLALVMSRCL